MSTEALSGYEFKIDQLKQVSLTFTKGTWETIATALKDCADLMDNTAKGEPHPDDQERCRAIAQEDRDLAEQIFANL
jgi:hypothetical protein